MPTHAATQSPLKRPSPFEPAAIYGEGPSPSRVLIAPHHYVQGPGVLERLGEHLALAGSRRPATLLTAGGRRRHGDALGDLRREAVLADFRGECSRAEIERLTEELADAEPAIDAVVALGGGKCLDTGKCVAYRLGVPAVAVPTIASTDAPCSAVSVIYDEDGRFEDVEQFPDNPALVLVDTEVIAAAPVRFLVAGMGDALATRYEARTCLANPDARTILGARMTLAGVALADRSAEVVFDHGLDAARDVRAGRVTEAVERVVEANTLLSGVGFEGGGLAAAHALATGGLTALPAVHRDHYHGEMVAVGLLAQLALEGEDDEARRVAEFLADVGLPVHLRQLSVDPEDAGALATVAEVAASVPIMANEPFEVTPDDVVDALRRADALGRGVAERVGDDAWRALHGRA